MYNAQLGSDSYRDLERLAALWGLSEREAMERALSDAFEIIRQALCVRAPLRSMSDWLRVIIEESADKVSLVYPVSSEKWIRPETSSGRRMIAVSDEHGTILRILSLLLQEDNNTVGSVILRYFSIIADQLEEKGLINSEGEWLMTNAINSALAHWSRL